MQYRIATVAFIALVAFVTLVPTASAARSSSAHYVVVVKAGASPAAIARGHGVVPTKVFSHSIRGFAAPMSAATRARVAANPAVRYVAVDRPMSIAARPDKPGKPGGGGEEPPTASTQSTPLGVLRAGAPAWIGDGVGATDVDVAVIDTGISDHADLDVVGGVNCSTGRRWTDGHGHGTHVAGTVGAIDNDRDVVGTAPGARLWAVRVLSNSGSGSISSVICGIDWVTANADTIEVANMSLGGSGSDDGACGATNGDPMHEAICASVAAGVTYVVAAGNDSTNGSGFTPAAYDEVITVSALADSDGAAGGLGGPTCRGTADDTFAPFSNFGADVDVAAPGECIESTSYAGGLATMSGTSMASPHVAGAAASWLARHPGSSPAQVQAAITSTADGSPIAGDGDPVWEGVLDLAALLA